MFLTRASAVGVVGSFALGGLDLGIFYYVVVARTVQAAATALGAGSSGASSVAASTGLLFAAMFAIDAVFAAIAGATFGGKLRRVSSFSTRTRLGQRR